jgi:hypothetical protein
MITALEEKNGRGFALVVLAILLMENRKPSQKGDKVRDDAKNIKELKNDLVRMKSDIMRSQLKEISLPNVDIDT